jgi:hypothetical protein
MVAPAGGGTTMSIGSGIFLAALVIAVVLLYGITKDRWGWRKIVRRTAVALLALIALGGLTFSASYLWDRLPASIQTDYAGLRLGMDQNEVRYIKGHPPTVFGEEEMEGDQKWRKVVQTKDLLKGERVEDYAEWSYDIAGGRLDVEFNPAKTAIIVISCYSTDRLKRCPPVVGLYDGDAEQEVVRKLGKPDKARISGVTKSLYYSKLGLFFNLEREQVYMLGINDTRYQKVGS